MAVLYESGTAVSQAVGGGLGFLSDAVGIQVTNSVNGEFYLEMLYPNDSLLSKELLENRLIKADAGTSLKNQLFIIKKVQRFNDGSQSLQTSSGSSVSIPTGIYVYAEQVGLSLTKDISLKQPTVTINSQDATGALTVWKNNLAINTPFVVDSDIATQNSTAFTLADFQHASDALAGTTGSILDVWGGEYKFDNYHISLLQRMGKTVNGILSYGRNIQTIEQESDISTIYNSIIPYATVSQPSGDSSVDIIHVLSGSDYIQAGSYANQYPYPITLPVDFSDQFYASDASADEKQGKYAYSDAQLKALAQKYLSDNEVGKPTANMTVTAIDLSKSLEYQGTNEQPIELGDIVPTNYEPLAISGTAEVTQTIWDDITKQYVEYTFGQKQTLTSAMVSIADNAVSGVQKQVTAINTIINGLGQPDSYSGDPTAGYPADPVLGQKFFLTDGNNQYIYQYSYDDATGTYYWKELVSTYTSQEIDNKVSSVVSDAKSYTDDLNDSLTPQIAAIDSQASNAVVGAQTANNNVNSLSSATDISTSQANSNASQAINQASEAILAASNANVSVSSLSGELTTNKTAIASNAQVIATKADQTTVNSLGSQVGSQSTLLAQTASEVALKADSAAVSSLSGQVSENSAQIAVNANSIQDTVTSINNLQIGGRNLVLGTSNAINVLNDSNGSWTQSTSGLVSSIYGQSDQLTVSFFITLVNQTSMPKFRLNFTNKWGNDNQTTAGASIYSFDSVWTIRQISDTEYFMSAPFLVNFSSNGIPSRIDFVAQENGIPNSGFNITSFKVEEGNKPTAWSPAPEDMATEADLLITSSEVATKVSEADFSTYQTQTASAIAAKVSNDSFASYQQQVADGFSQTVSTSTFNTLQTQVNNFGQTNLIANSDFNPDTGGWITWKNATLGTVLSNLHNVSGKNVMEITASTTGIGPRVISQPIPINSLNSTTSPTVSLSFAYYVFTGSTNYFQIQYLDDAGTDMGYAGAVALSGSGWQAYVLQNITLTIPTGATHIALLFDARANGKLGIAMPMLVNGSTIGSYVPGPYVGQTTAQTSAMSTINQDLTSITDFVTDGNGNMGTGLLTALEATTLMQGLDGTKSIMSQTSAAWTVALQNTGAPNLLANTSDMTDLTGWGSSTANDVSIVEHSFYANGTRNLFKLSTSGIGEVYLTSDRIPLIGGATYTVQLKAFHNSAQTSMDIFLLTRSASSTNAYDHAQSKQNLVPSVSAINEYTVTITVPADVASGYVRIDNNGSSTSGTSADLYVTEIKLAQESIASPYSSKPIDGNSLLAQINVQAGTTLIQNDKIYLNASSIVFGGTAFINDAMVTDLSASKLTAGTIDASKITVINLDANNISANASAFFTTQWQSNYGQYLSITASEIDFITSSNTAKINSSGFTVYQGSGQFGFNVTKWGDSSGGTTSSYGTYMGTYTSNGFLAFTGNGIGSTLVWMDSGMSKGSQVGELGAWNFYRDVLIAPDASNTNQSRQLSFFGTNYGIKADNQHSSLNFYTQNHFWFSHKIVVNGSVASTSLLSLKTIIGEMGTTEAIDDILATDIEKYYFNDDPDQVIQLSPIIDDVNTTPKYSIPAIINNGDSVNIYAMASLSFLAIKQLVAELGDYTIKGTTLLDGKNVKANSMSVNSLDANYIAVNNGILNLSSSDKTSVVQINSGSVLIQQNTSAGVLDGQMLINAYSFSVFYGSNLMTMEADGIHMLDENSLLYTNIYNGYIEMSATQSSTQAISVGGLITTYDSTNGGGVFLIANTPGMGGTTHNSSSGNYWNAANVGLAYRNSTTDENSVGFALRYNVTGQTIYINSTDVVFSNSAGTGNGKIHFGTAGSAYGIQVDSTGASMNFYSSDHFWFSKKIEVVSTTYTSLLSKKNVLGEYKYDALNEINKTDIRLIKFKSQPNDKEHLTAIIDDVNEQSKYYLPSIMKDDGGVDLYSAVSLTFLAIKKEDSKVEKLKKRVNELENQVKMLQSA
ncbi:phage tail spike protein [Oenococcus oeni]|uniref:phage tail spike protein n=1 Tax=Oenococcus oeni TaxID=1247 RepID=UPI000277B8E0|nr:phage tail spike protein [Oenococcus oeni]EJO10531.1 phage endopeptidase [Oenococcus oeni AWRIB576]